MKSESTSRLLRKNWPFKFSILSRIIIKQGLKENGKDYKKLKPVPTIFDPEEGRLSAESKHLKSLAFVPKKLPTKSVYQQD